MSKIAIKWNKASIETSENYNNTKNAENYLWNGIRNPLKRTKGNFEIEHWDAPNVQNHFTHEALR